MRELVLLTVLIAGATLAACSALPEPAATPESAATTESAVPTSTPLAEPSFALTSPTGSNAPFVVPAFDGPEPHPVQGGTTHVLENANRDASDFYSIQYTVPSGWEVGDVYIGKNLGRSDEVAISFWTPRGVYADPCRRTRDQLSPVDLANHSHTDSSLVLMNYPQIGLSAQHERAATEARSVIVDDPSEEGGTIALRLELTVPADLDLASCDDGLYAAWPAGDSLNDNHVAGQTDIIYQVDFDLGPLIIDASFRPESSPEDVEELYAVLGSIAVDRY